MDDEIRVGESVEPVIQALPDEVGVIGKELRGLLISSDPNYMGENIAD